MRIFASVGVLSFLLFACDESHTNAVNCGSGTQHSGTYGVACSYVVVVTGFECPPEVPYHEEFEGGHVCFSKPFDAGELPQEICTAFDGKCEAVAPPDSGVLVDGSAGCIVSDDCPDGQYCKGDCSAPGQCTPYPPAGCTEENKPNHCTCDGKPVLPVLDSCMAYRFDLAGENAACAAAHATACLENTDCAEGEYCKGDCSGPGQCTPLPGEDIACAELAVPICQCDGTVIEGAPGCNFERHETAESSATCKTAIDNSCTSNEQCADGEYCKGDCSARGQCTPIPEEACPPNTVDYCGCDGQALQSNSGCVYDRYTPGDTSCYASACLTAEDCNENQYCDGDCTGPGVCRDNGDPADRACNDAPTGYCDCNGVGKYHVDSCITEPHPKTASGAPATSNCTLPSIIPG